MSCSNDTQAKPKTPEQSEAEKMLRDLLAVIFQDYGVRVQRCGLVIAVDQAKERVEQLLLRCGE